MQYKETTKLYQGKYQHRIVLVCYGAGMFRGGNLNTIFKRLSEVEVGPPSYSWQTYPPPVPVRNQADLNYLFDVYSCLSRMEDFTVRVENPWLSIYTNDEKDIRALRLIDSTRVKAIYQPAAQLEEGVCVSSLPYDFKVFVKPNDAGHDSFIEWAESNDNIKLTKSVVHSLKGFRRSNQSYFYVSGDKNLTMARIYLGGLVKRVDRIVRRDTNIS